MNSQTIYQIKRFLLNFAEKMTDSFTRPQSYFIRDLLYGIAKSQSVILTDIARALGENIDLKYTLKRLSRNCLLFDAWQTLENNYFKAIRPSIQEDDVLILDGSDLVKSYGQKMEYITTIKDPVTNRYAKGYPTINVAIATQESKHPLPIYQKIYSPEAPDFISKNIEIYKAIDAADRLYGEINYIATGDRGFDRNDFMKYLLTRERDFVIRMKKNRVVHYANQRLNVHKLGLRRKGKIRFDTKIDGQEVKLKISHVKITLPAFGKQIFYLLIVYGFGEEPMYLLTNRIIQSKADVIRHLKIYLTRWRIEELFRVQKNTFDIERMQAHSFNTLQLLYQLVNHLISLYSLSIEKRNMMTEKVLLAHRQCKGLDKIKFYLYRYIEGFSRILSFDTVGLFYFRSKEGRSLSR